MSGQDYASYEDYYRIGIEPIITKFRQQYDGIIVKKDAKQIIWNEYIKFNTQCKEKMKDSNNLLDRHKVVACYMLAILKSNVLFQETAFEQGDESLLLLNERLAFIFGLSLLRSMINDLVYRIQNPQTRDKLIEAFKEDVSLPKCTHGEHSNNILWQLFYTKKEGTYNVLLLAESLYLIECFNLIKCGIDEDYLRLSNLG